MKGFFSTFFANQFDPMTLGDRLTGISLCFLVFGDKNKQCEKEIVYSSFIHRHSISYDVSIVNPKMKLQKFV